mmetsp:Transcript_28628/g.53930  ORF Transcript_28628/g.53930 Transcript_28628/m.53930 type:complete len:473 (-) Transcript_28628:3714-5132(-)
MTSSIYLIGALTEPAEDIVRDLSESTLDTLILEAGNLTATDVDINGNGLEDDYIVGGAQFTTEQVRGLIENGADGEDRTVFAYVNVIVPDHNRYFWNPDWVIPDDDDPRDLDYGTFNPDVEIPQWLTGNLGTAGGPEFYEDGTRGDDIFGFLADFQNEEWRQLVVTQAVTYAQHGYNGIFLDDVSRYFSTSLPTGQAAEAMMRFVIEIEQAVIEATDFTRETLNITINSDAYIINNYVYGDGGAGYANADLELITEFRAAVDGLVAEGVEDPAVSWDIANEWFSETAPDGLQVGGATTQFTAIEEPQDWAAMNELLAVLEVQGVSLFLARDASYTDVLNAPQIGTAGNDNLTGTDLAEAIFGVGGSDTIFAGGGDDIIYGSELGSTIYAGDGDDLIYGGPGDDLIYAGSGNDTIYGGGGNDTIIGGSGDDTVYGGAGDDVISGGGGSDVLSGAPGADTIYGGDLPDTFLFEI